MPTLFLAEPGTPPSAHPRPLHGIILLQRQRDRSSERLSNLPKVTKQIPGKASWSMPQKLVLLLPPPHPWGLTRTSRVTHWAHIRSDA